ncbi:MAG: SH3 domain-containing protein [Caldilineaceae bacterium]
MSFRSVLVSLLLLAGAVVASACGSSAPPPISTRPPAPTFTPTPEVAQPPVQVEAPAPVEQPVQVEQPAQVEQPVNNAAEQPAATQPPAEEPTATATPVQAQAVVNIQQLNVRGGPSTANNIIGSADAGQSFPVTGKNQAGDWWEIDFNGQRGWVFGQLVTTQNVESVALAQVIPTAPPATPTPIPPPTQPPAPSQPPAPAAPAEPQYEFNVAVVGRCAPQEGGTWFEGKVYKNGQPSNGHKVVFSYAPDGAPSTNPMISGPHEGYRNWDAGYYSHIIAANKPVSGNWYIWIVNDAGQRISKLANFQSKGPGGDCNQAVVDFDSR